MGGSFLFSPQTGLAPDRYTPAPASLDMPASVRMPHFAFSPDCFAGLPQPSNMLPTPAPQAAERWIASACAGVLEVSIPFHQPGIAGVPFARAFVDRTPASDTPAVSTPEPSDFSPAPAAEPAERWIATASANALPAAIASRLPEIGAMPFAGASVEPTPAVSIPELSDFVPTPAAQPAERWLAPASAGEFPAAIPFHLPGIGSLPFAGASVEPTPASDTAAVAIPELSDFVPVPAAQAAERWIATASACEFPADIPFRQPNIGELPITSTFVRQIETFALTPEADPVEHEVRAVLDSRPAPYQRPLALLRFSLHTIDEVGSRPVAAGLQAPPPAGSRPGLRPIPLESLPYVPPHAFAAMPASPALQVPAVDAALAHVLPPAQSVEGPAAMPVESMPAARALPAVLDMVPELRLPTLAGLRPVEDATEQLASHVPAAGPVPVESLPSVPAFVAVPAPISPAVLAQAFHPALNARFDIPVVAGPEPVVAAPPTAVPQPAMLNPMARIEAQPAGGQPERPVPAIPTPGPFELEYHCQRITSVPVTRIEPIETSLPLVRQPFSVPAAPPRYSELVKKPSRLVLPFEELFSKKKKEEGEKRGAKINTYGKIAAAIMVGIALYTGMRLANLSQHTDSFRAQVASSERTVTVAESGISDPTQVNYGNGKMGKLRRAIATRAATEITDTFRGGMAAWGSEKASYAPGWQQTGKGYVTTGAMALFQPSLKYTDYRMEFYGQIEDKSMGWVVRAQDKKNYLAMKFSVIQSGLRPIIAMVHYGVVNGKAGHKVETPLSVMVHNNRPFQVAVDVKDNHFTASIDGERIESWTDDTSAQGGVGFFSEPGEKARLYWMKLSRNQDWLGRFCAYLSDGRAKQTAEIWNPASLPGGPGPAAPQFPALALVAAGPFKIRKHRRSEGWTH